MKIESIVDKKYFRPYSGVRSYSTEMPKEEPCKTCPREVAEHWQSHRDEIIQKKLEKQKGIILHGAQNVNKQVKKAGLPVKYIKKTYDYDVFTNTPKEHAEEMAQHINKQYGIKFATAVRTVMGRAPLSAKVKGEDRLLYRIKTPINAKEEYELDYMTPPKDLKVERINGVVGESLECVVNPKRIYKSAQGVQWNKRWREATRIKEIIKEKKRRGLK
jgi:hypothetical protein